MAGWTGRMGMDGQAIGQGFASCACCHFPFGKQVGNPVLGEGREGAFDLVSAAAAAATTISCLTQCV